MIRPMMRIGFIALFSLATPSFALAIEAPATQAHIDGKQILRGIFTEDRPSKSVAGTMQISGHFVVAPAYGLLWNIEQPFPTTTIITPKSIVQDVGGIAIDLPKNNNLEHLYEMVESALAGNWNKLNDDFVITPQGTGAHWTRVLTPRPGADNGLSYNLITVTGGQFVETIVLTKNNGKTETLVFTNETLSPTPPSALELASFQEGKKH